MSTRSAALIFLCFAGSYSVAVAHDGDIDTGAVELLLIDNGIYAVAPKFAGANGALILDEAGHIVVDSHGTPASAQALIDAVKSISDVPIRYVINTHWHVDHHVGNSAYRSTFGKDVIFISHDETRNEIPSLGAEQFEQVAAYRSMPIEAAEAALADATDAHGSPLTPEQLQAIETFRDAQVAFAEAGEYRYTLADLTYSDSVTLHGSAQNVEVFFLHPAHTRSDSIVYIREQKILIVGDILTQPILWSWSSFPSSYVKTLAALEALDVDKIVIGHGGPVLEGKAYLTLVRQFMESTVAHSVDSHAAGLSYEDAITAAATAADIQAFRRRFVTEEQDGMFDQMLGWTIWRAYAEF